MATNTVDGGIEMKRAVYAVYRGDEFITVGTAQEISKELNWKVETIRTLATPSRKRRSKGDQLEVYRLEDEEG